MRVEGYMWFNQVILLNYENFILLWRNIKKVKKLYFFDIVNFECNEIKIENIKGLKMKKMVR